MSLYDRFSPPSVIYDNPVYTVYLVRLWSIAHLRVCCWYIDYRKAFCLIEEKDAKKACDEAESQGSALGANQGEVQEDEVEVDINKLPEKEKNKVLNQRKRDADRIKAKTDREALRAKEKAEWDAKKGGRSGKSKAVVASTPSPVLPQVSTTSQSQNPRKRDSSCAQLSLSRLQQITSPALMDSTGGGVCMYRSSSSLDPFCPLMHTICNTRPSPRNGWI
jgi:hypothetical protein